MSGPFERTRRSKLMGKQTSGSYWQSRIGGYLPLGNLRNHHRLFFFGLLEDVGLLVDFEGLIDPVEKPLLSKVLPLFLSTQPCTNPLLSRISTLCWESLRL